MKHTKILIGALIAALLFAGALLVFAPAQTASAQGPVTPADQLQALLQARAQLDTAIVTLCAANAGLANCPSATAVVTPTVPVTPTVVVTPTAPITLTVAPLPIVTIVEFRDGEVVPAGILVEIRRVDNTARTEDISSGVTTQSFTVVHRGLIANGVWTGYGSTGDAAKNACGQAQADLAASKVTDSWNFGYSVTYQGGTVPVVCTQ